MKENGTKAPQDKHPKEQMEAALIAYKEAKAAYEVAQKAVLEAEAAVVKLIEDTKEWKEKKENVFENGKVIKGVDVALEYSPSANWDRIKREYPAIMAEDVSVEELLKLPAEILNVLKNLGIEVKREVVYGIYEG